MLTRVFTETMLVDTEFLRRVPYRAELGPLEVRQVAAKAVERRFGKGEFVFLEGTLC